MTTRQKRRILQKVLSIYQNSAERVAAYKRSRLYAMAVVWLCIFFAVLLSFYPGVMAKVGIAIAFIGGVAGGRALTYASAATSWPLVVRYTTLKEEELKKALAEIEGVPQNGTNL